MLRYALVQLQGLSEDAYSRFDEEVWAKGKADLHRAIQHSPGCLQDREILD